MGRWQPDTQRRLQDAALELITEQGYRRTTAVEIADRAGVTERTFFRYFADKREVLFAGQDRLQHLIVDGLAAAPPDLAPLDAVVVGLIATTGWFDERRGTARARQDLIDCHPELHERELAKMAALSAAIAQALHARGTSGSESALAAAAGLAAFRLALAKWLADSDEQDLAADIVAAVDDLRLVASR